MLIEKELNEKLKEVLNNFEYSKEIVDILRVIANIKEEYNAANKLHPAKRYRNYNDIRDLRDVADMIENLLHGTDAEIHI